MSAIVTGAKSRMGYIVARSLSRRGVRTIVADHVPLSMTFFSRYPAGHFVYPSPYSAQEEFLALVREKAKEHRAQVLLPVYEETFLLSKYRHLFEGLVGLPVPDYESILSVHRKDTLSRLAEELGIPCPRTRPLRDLASLEEEAAAVGFPLVLKPRQGGGNWAVEYVWRPEELRPKVEARLTADNLSCERLLLQEYVPAAEKFSHALLCCRGEVRASYMDQHLRDYPASGGAGTLRVSVHRPQMAELTTRLFRHLGWHGLGEAEYVTHRDTGQPYLIEVNPRVWGGINSAVAAGLDIPYLLYCLGRDGDVAQASDYRLGVKTRWLLGDLKAFRGNLAHAPSKGRFLIEFLGLGAQFDELSLLDPLPFCALFADIFYRFLKGGLHVAPHDSLRGEWT